MLDSRCVNMPINITNAVELAHELLWCIQNDCSITWHFLSLLQPSRNTFQLKSRWLQQWSEWSDDKFIGLQECNNVEFDFENFFELVLDQYKKIPRYIMIHNTLHGIANFAIFLDTFILKNQGR